METYGLSDFAVAHLSDVERRHLEQLKGEIVAHSMTYLKVTSSDSQKLSKRDYAQALSQAVQSKVPQRVKFMRVSLNLIHEGQRTFAFVGSERIDYSPANMKPTAISIQYRQEFDQISNDAVQTWANTSAFVLHQLSVGNKSYTPSALPDNRSEEKFMDDSAATHASHSYLVHWKQPALFHNIAGVDFSHVTQFEVPKDTKRVDVSIQISRPNVSDQLTYEIHGS
ncbi:hypothetical protein NIE88_06195 [Sporolactobacillus shoreicorticis]|uniref:Uncharacterized protein n=1 Tax=Sporolactobacillus shoreicorticis TaxID=1923877 RepID=A0ABW5S1Q7_9BACL|nr:hypothetical protein [Sporolactobacillus shoreicorticis]MCO7125356.1 hypothetical protein [Sporolactobacillus shoreicorticis]